jgi:diguanylate cyclase (GGDEF)-like protein
VIIQLATQLLSTLRDTDFISRIGGDEFAVILQYVDTHVARHMMERICHAVEQWEGIPITISIGIANISSNDQQSFINADHALYRSKHKGKNCVSDHGFEQFSVITNDR